MTAPIRFTSGRQQQQKIGVTGDTDNKKVLEVVGRAGIGTTIFEPSTSLDVRGDVNVSGSITATSFDGSFVGTIDSTNIVGSSLSISGISTLGVSSLTDVTAQQLDVSGISTFGSRVQIDANVGIGTTNPTGIVTSTNTTVLHVGVVTANYYYGDGTNLTMTNSIGLGTDTHGDYVKSISGTTNEIEVTGGTGEGSTPTLSLAPNPTIGGNVTVGTDLQVNNNLNVTGSITIGGSAAFLDSETLRVKDADIVLGFTTNANNEDVSTDTTANHGGIAIASTEGSPLVTLAITGIETLPATYKKIMWFKAGSFTGLNTDSWLSNYAIGIGSTQLPAGTRLAAGSVQFSENDLSVVRDINASGVITATSGFSGSLTGDVTGTASTADNVNKTVSAGLGLTGGGTLTDDITLHVGIGTTAGLEIADDEVRLKNYNNLINNNILTWDTTGGVGQISTSQITDDGTNVTIGSGITFYVSSGVVSATSYFGSGGNLEDIIKGKIEGINALDSEGTYVGAGFSFSALQFTDNRVSVTGIGTTLQIALGTPGYATTAGFATDLTGGTKGDIPYQTSADSTSFLNIGATGEVLLASSDGLPVWGPVTDATSSLGISVEDDLTNVGGASSVTTINFGANLGVTSATSEVGLVTVTVSDTPSFTLVSASSSIGIGTTNPLQALQVGTANTLGFTTDGTAVVITGIGTVGIGTISPRYTLDVLGDINLDGTFYQNGSQFVASRWTTGIGNSIYRLSNVGIGTTNPEATLDVKGNLKVGTAITASAGVITATKFVTSGATSSDFIKGDGSTDSNTYLTAESDTIDTVLGRGNSTTKGVQITGISTLGITTLTNVTAQQLNVSGIATFQDDVNIGSAGATAFFDISSGRVGIGSTIPTKALDIDGTLGVSGVSIFTNAVSIDPSNSTTIPLNFEYAAGTTPQISFSRTSTTRYGIHYFMPSASNGHAIHQLDSISNFEIGLNGGSFIVGLSAFPVSTKAFEVKEDAETYLTYNHNKKLETTGYGVTVTGGLNVSGISTLTGVTIAGSASSITFDPSTNVNKTFFIRGEGNGSATIENDDEMYVSSTHLYIQNPGGTTTMAEFIQDGSVKLNHNNITKLQTNASGIDVTGHTETDTLRVSGISTFQDNVDFTGLGKSITLGTTGISAMFLDAASNGVASIKHESTLFLAGTDGIDIINYAATKYSGRFFPDTGVELYYNNAKKFETTTDGVAVTGTLSATSFSGDGSALTGIAAGGDGADFNTGLTTTAYASASDDIDGFTAIGVTFPTTADKRYLVTSMHITNVSPSDLYLTSRIDYDGGENVPLTNRVIVPYQGSLEIVDESFITNPSDNLRFAAFTGIGTTAGGVTNGLDCWVTYETKDDTNYIGIGSTVPTTGNHTVFTSNTNPSTINTINLTNYSNFVDVDASVSIYRGGTIRQGYLAYNLTIPQNSTVQILPRAKRLNASDTIVVNAEIGSALSVNIAGKYIT